MRVRKRTLAAKFFADRGTHLAAMIAYFALLSFVPLTFLSLSLLGLAGRADESTFLVQEIRRSLPGVPIVRIVSLVNAVRGNAATLGLIGAVVLLWTSLSFFSVLESAFNIVYDRPNRSFLRGKLLAFVLMIGSLITLFVALLAGSIGFGVAREYVPGLDNGVVAYALSVAVSTAGVFAFLVCAYYLLTNDDDVRVRDVLPGAALATVGLEASFQVLPLYVRYAHVNAAVNVFGGTAILLIWLYVMANVIVFGAELNWWFGRRRAAKVEEGVGLA